jgi:hypothetical protein
MDFEAELMGLIDRAVAEGVERDDIVSALELRVMALKEEQAGDDLSQQPDE